ncbi:MAG: tetratricopeptide repeat protein [Candidatus Hodarchaeota archaeon]
MHESNSKRLKLVEQLVKEQKFDDALQELEKISNEGHLQVTDLLTCNLLKSRILNKKGNYKRALATAEAVYRKSQDHDVKGAVDSAIEMAEALLRLGRLEECLKIVEQAEKILDNSALERLEVYKRQSTLKNRKGTVYLTKRDLSVSLKLFSKSLLLAELSGDERCIAAPLQNIGYVHFLKGEIKRSLEHYRRSLAIYETLDDRAIVAHSLYNIGTAYWKKGQLTHAVDHYRKSLAIYEGLGNTQGIASVFLNMALVHRDSGELNLALDCSMKALDFYEKSGNKHFIVRVYNTIGTIHLNEGKLDKALEYFRKRQLMTEELGNKPGIALSLNNIGTVYYYKGEIDHALEYYLQSLEIYRELGDRQAIARSYHNIGGIFKNKGNFETALSYYEKSLEIKQELDNSLDLSMTLFMINDLLAAQDISKNRIYLKRLQEINENSDNKVIDQLFRVAKGVLLKNNPDETKREEARDIFRQVAGESIVDYELTILVNYYSCEMLFNDFIERGEKKTLEELKKQLNALQELSAHKNYHGVKLAVLMLISKLEQLELNFDNAESIFQAVIAEAQVMGKDRIVEQCIKELEEIKMLEAYKDSNKSDLREELAPFSSKKIEELHHN